MSKFNFLIFLIFLIFRDSIGVKSFKSITLRNIQCEGNPEIVVNFTCVLKAVNRDKVIGILDGDVITRVTNVMINFNTFARLNGWKQWIIHGTFDLCEVLAGKYHPLFKIFKSTLIKYTNINHTCPFEGHLFVRDLVFDSLDFGNSILPPKDYRAVLRGYGYKTQYFNITIDVRIT
ncbi:uncharacterized protein LOC129618902 [Condylostylus longicornis]|uniref:uncharacterized protein LOC129618902 n=1 Tax=Condylostylus longicornis TaxID=2530218 RepID=UPI00244DF023|nr:uncharacterized protein LOC129618902 [Condylostylus longicornis]